MKKHKEKGFLNLSPATQTRVEQTQRAQGAFEYLMSYGWAVLIVTVLGIVLFNLGVFNSSQSTVISGFAFLKPFSVQVDFLSPDDARIIARVQNVGGRDYSISSTTVSSPSSNCSYSLVQVADSLGNVIATTVPKLRYSYD
jgi:hypothetical protein